MARGKVVALEGRRVPEHRKQRSYGFEFVKEYSGHAFDIKDTAVFWVAGKDERRLGKGRRLGNLEQARAKHRDEEQDGDLEEGEEEEATGRNARRRQREQLLRIWSLDARTARLFDAQSEFRRLVFPSGKSFFLLAVLHIPEKQVLVAASADLRIKFYDARLDLIGSVELKQRAVYGLAYNPKTDQLVTAGVDGVCFWQCLEAKKNVWDRQNKLWRAVTEHSLTLSKTLAESKWSRKMHLDKINDVLFVMNDCDVLVYRADAGTVKTRLVKIHSQPVTDCIYYASSHYFVSCSHDGDIKVWSEVRGNSLVHSFTSHSKSVTAIALHPSREVEGLLLSCSLDCTARVFSLETLEELYNVQLRAPCSGMKVFRDPNEPLQTHANNLLLQTGRTIQVWKLQHMTRTFVPGSSEIKRIWNFYSPIDAVTLVLVHAADGSLRLYKAENGALVSRIVPDKRRTIIDKVQYCVERGTLIVLFACNEVAEFDFARDPAVPVATWATSIPPKDRVNALAITQLPVSVPAKKGVVGSAGAIGNLSKAVQPSRTRLLLGSDRFVPSAEQQTAGLFLLGGTEHGSIYVWDLANSGAIHASILTAHAGPITLLDLHESSSTLVSGTRDGGLKTWNLETLHVNQDIAALVERRNSQLSCLALSPLHPLLFVGLSSGESDIIDFFTGAPVPDLVHDHSHRGPITQACFNDSLRLVISVSLDGTLKVWDERKALVCDLDLHGEPLQTLGCLGDLGDILIGERGSIVSISSEMFLSHRYETLRRHLETEEFALLAPNLTWSDGSSSLFTLIDELGEDEIEEWQHQVLENSTLQASRFDPACSNQEVAQTLEQRSNEDASLAGATKNDLVRRSSNFNTPQERSQHHRKIAEELTHMSKLRLENSIPSPPPLRHPCASALRASASITDKSKWHESPRRHSLIEFIDFDSCSIRSSSIMRPRKSRRKSKQARPIPFPPARASPAGKRQTRRVQRDPTSYLGSLLKVSRP